MLNLSNNLTVFVIKSGDNPNYEGCVQALQKQTILFNMNLVRNYAPMSKAFQEMLNRVTTEYFIQVDEDMILKSNAIELMYNTMQNIDSKIAMKCFYLKDIHLNFNLYGVKIYKSEIFKKYPYNQAHVSCEVEQLDRMKVDGYTVEFSTEVMGDHSPLWTNKNIYERYQNLMYKYKIAPYDWLIELPKKLYLTFKENPTELNFFAIAGLINGLSETKIQVKEKDYTAPIKGFSELTTMFNTPLVDLKPIEKIESSLKIVEKKINVLRLVDQWNWAYDHIAREQAIFSKHNIITNKLADINISHLNGIDILYIPGPNMGKSMTDALIKTVRQNYPKCKIIGGYAGEHDIMFSDLDIVVAISAKFYPQLKVMYKPLNKSVVYLPESVDTKYFTPGLLPKEFTVGWAGRIAPVKRCHLLDKLIYPVKRQSNHGAEFFKTPNRSLQPMLEFYRSLSCLVLTSSSEAMPRVVLEAMACGLNIISTDVGSLRMLVDDFNLIPVNPEEKTVSEMNSMLKHLSENPEFVKEMGKTNRLFIEQNFSWEVNQPIWDKFFEDVYKGHFVSAEIYNKKLRDYYGQREPALLN